MLRAASRRRVVLSGPRILQSYSPFVLRSAAQRRVSSFDKLRMRGRVQLPSFETHNRTLCSPAVFLRMKAAARIPVPAKLSPPGYELQNAFQTRRRGMPFVRFLSVANVQNKDTESQTNVRHPGARSFRPYTTTPPEVWRLFTSVVAGLTATNPCGPASCRTYAARRLSTARHRSLGRLAPSGVTPKVQGLRSRSSRRYATPAPCNVFARKSGYRFSVRQTRNQEPGPAQDKRR